MCLFIESIESNTGCSRGLESKLMQWIPGGRQQKLISFLMADYNAMFSQQALRCLLEGDGLELPSIVGEQ